MNILVILAVAILGAAGTSGAYVFVTGCEKGIACGDEGRKCGTIYLCKGCTFEECEEKATSINVDGFSYRSTSDGYCRKCSKTALETAIKESNDYGVYRKQASASTGWASVSKGCPKKYPDETVMLSLEGSKHTVRCCNDKGDVCISEPCKSDASYQAAVEHCSNQGLRLCFEEELNQCCGTGCQFDHTTNWIADPAQGGCDYWNKNAGCPQDSTSLTRLHPAIEDDLASCLELCKSGGYTCCRANYDWSPFRCHGGMEAIDLNWDNIKHHATAVCA